MSHIRYGLHSPSIWRVRRLRTHHNWASHSFTLLLVGCHINCDGTTNATMYSFFVFTHCHLSLSSITTITYSLSINPSHAMSVLWHPQRILRNFYLYFSSTRFYIASNDASILEAARAHCVLLSHVSVCSRACLPLQHVFRISHRTRELSNSSTVCQLAKETELELIAWIPIASSYLYKSFQSCCRRKVWLFNRSFVRLLLTISY